MINRPSDLFNISDRFLRSIHLERDFYDPDVLSGYIATETTRSSLRRIKQGLATRSGHRAWRMTGDYGSGKSSFAVVLAHCFAGQESTLPPAIRKITNAVGWSQPEFLPVLVTCSRQSLGRSIVNGLLPPFEHSYGNNSKATILAKLRQISRRPEGPSDDEVLNIVLEANSRVILDCKGRGLVLILDELGKYLEFAALHPESQDVFLLQRLAEAASRSGTDPLFVVSIVHQGFDAYADRLSHSAQREWQKVAGRFEEIVFDQPLGQVIELIASALNVQASRISRSQREELSRGFNSVAALGWFGSRRQKGLIDRPERLYPLHPSVLPVLVRTFRRFGQNERSIFSFLLANEPFGLRSFADQPVGGSDLYRLHDFYDYVRTNFGHRLSAQSYRSHWNLIDSVVDSFDGENEIDISVLKTVGILNLLNDTDLLPTTEAVVTAVAHNDHTDRKRVEIALQKLHRNKRTLFNRGGRRGFCLWPHTSVDLEKAYDERSDPLLLLPC